MRGGRVGLRGAVLSLACLGGGLALSFPAMLLLSTAAPGLAERSGPWLFFSLMALVCAAGGLIWGARLSRLARSERRRAWALAGALGYGLSAPLATAALTGAETFLLERALQGSEYPVHVAFGAIFATSVLLVVGVTALALGLASGRGAGALRLAGLAAATGVGSFLAVDLAFDLAGWRVGAPGAEERFTMLVVLGAGLLVATSAAGAVLARSLALPSARPVHPPA